MGDRLRGHANAGVTVMIAKTAQPHHLRDMAATLAEMAQQMEANTPTEEEAFLAMMLTAAQTGTRVTVDDVARLRRLADWADAAPCQGWNGTLDRGETQRAVDDAREKMG